MKEELTALYESARLSIIEGDDDLALEVLEKAKELDADLMNLLLYGFGTGNEELANEYDQGKISIAELIYGTEIMKSVTDSVLDYLNDGKKAGPVETGRPRVLLATVAGDIHDIGKNIVRVLLENYNYEVIDLGRDVPPETIVEETRKQDTRMSVLRVWIRRRPTLPGRFQPSTISATEA